MFQTKFVEKIKKLFLASNPFSENPSIYEIRWKNMVEPDRSQMTVRHVCFVCWITKAATDTHTHTHTHTHREYVIDTYFFSVSTMDKRTRLCVRL